MEPATTRVPSCSALVEQVELFLRDAKRCKHRHFFAADRKQDYDYLFQVVGVIASAALAFFGHSMIEYNNSLFLSVAAVAFAVTVLQAGLSLSRVIAGHRTVGNRYLALMRRAEILLASHRDGRVAPDALEVFLKELLEAYLAVNEIAEQYPTSAADYQKAMEHMKQTATERPLTLGTNVKA